MHKDGDGILLYIATEAPTRRFRDAPRSNLSNLLLAPADHATRATYASVFTVNSVVDELQYPFSAPFASSAVKGS